MHLEWVPRPNFFESWRAVGGFERGWVPRQKIGRRAALQQNEVGASKNASKKTKIIQKVLKFSQNAGIFYKVS